MFYRYIYLHRGVGTSQFSQAMAQPRLVLARKSHNQNDIVELFTSRSIKRLLHGTKSADIASYM